MYALQARKIHIDIDATELNKVIPADVAIISDLRPALAAIGEAVSPRNHYAWVDTIERWRTELKHRETLNHQLNDSLPAPHVINEIFEATNGQAVIVTDVGQNQMWTAQYYATEHERTFLSSGGLGTMGFGLPAAIGAQFARPESEVWVIVGDGGFQMSLHEMAILVQEKLPIRIALLNNRCLGMVRQWQTMFYDSNYEATDLLNPDFVKLAEAYGIPSFRAASFDEARSAIGQVHNHSGPVLVEFEVARDGELSHVYPMVPTGAALDAMIHRTPVVVGTSPGGEQ